MEKIKLMTDSTCDLSVELVKELDLEVVPLNVSFEDDMTAYKDGVDIHQEDIVEHVAKTGKLPKTSAIAPGQYTEYFNKYINEGYSIIFAGIGSKLSSAYQSVLIGRNDCIDPEKVTIVDSNNLSSATGLVLLKCRDFINEGLSREEIANKIHTEIAPNLRCSFCIDRLDYMVMGGRCSAMKGFFAKVLNIKPIIVVTDGKLQIGKKPIGNLNIAIKTIYNDMMKEIKDIDPKYLMVTHFLSQPCADFIKPIINKTCQFENVYDTPAGSVIGSHCGPGTIGLLYILKTKEEAPKKASTKKTPVKKEAPKKETVKKEAPKKETVKKEVVKKTPSKKTQEKKPSSKKVSKEE